jgi:hypothetical protein
VRRPTVQLSAPSPTSSSRSASTGRTSPKPRPLWRGPVRASEPVASPTGLEAAPRRASSGWQRPRLLLFDRSGQRGSRVFQLFARRGVNGVGSRGSCCCAEGRPRFPMRVFGMIVGAAHRFGTLLVGAHGRLGVLVAAVALSALAALFAGGLPRPRRRHGWRGRGFRGVLSSGPACHRLPQVCAARCAGRSGRVP